MTFSVSELIKNYSYSTLQILMPKDKTELGIIALTALAAIYRPIVGVSIGIGYLSYSGYMKWKKLPDPSYVQDIYRLPPVTEELKEMLNDFNEKIEKLKKDDSFLGIAFVPNNSQTMSPVYLKFNQFNKSYNFFALDLQSDEQVGFATTYLTTGTNEDREGYIELLERVHVGFVNNTSKQHRNIGTVLFKTIMQFFMKKGGVYVTLDAVRNNGPFWYKLGFRTPKANLARNRTFARLANSKSITNEDFGSNEMFHCRSAMELWEKEIQENPILFWQKSSTPENSFSHGQSTKNSDENINSKSEAKLPAKNMVILDRDKWNPPPRPFKMQPRVNSDF